MKKLKETMSPEREESIIRASNGFAEKKKGNFLDKTNLPHHLVTYDILTRLPIKSLMRFKCVCKQWYSTISSYQFNNTLFKLSLYSHPSPYIHSIFIQWGKDYYLVDCEDYERRDNVDDDISNCLVELKVDFGERKDHLFPVGSCNGLLCLASYWGKIFIIWNPIICQWRKFEDPYALDFGDCWSAWGFGYVSSVDDYKVVRILQVTKTSEIQVHVFSLRTNRWTRIDADILRDVIIYEGTLPKLPTHLVDSEYPILFLMKVGALVNETLYWTLTKSTGPGRYVVAFDLVHDTVDIVPRALQNPGSNTTEYLCSVGGNLCTYRVAVFEDATMNLFMQPEEEEVVRLCSDDNKFMTCEGVVGFTRTGNMFILLDAGEIGVFNSKSSEMKYPRVLRPNSYQLNTGIASYVPSVISPFSIAKWPKT